MRFFATAAKGTESLVAQELTAIGAQKIRPVVRRCPFRGRVGNALPGEPMAPHGESYPDADSSVRLPDAGGALCGCP